MCQILGVTHDIVNAMWQGTDTWQGTYQVSLS